MPPREDDVAPRTGVPGRRALVQAGGFVLAVAATLAVFLTDDPQVLKLAVVGVAWAFVLATFAAASRSAERVAARAREAELRQAYEYELDREVAARREYELELETELRREAEDAMRAELDGLRDDLSGLTDLRNEVARVTELRTDMAALSELRDEVARVAALRDDVVALTSLRQELGQLAELRADMGRLRQELTEQLSSEMLVERIVMRTQAGRLTTGMQEAPGRAFDAATRWADDAAPRELTGGWPAIRLDEPRDTRQFEQVPVERARPPAPPPSVPPPPVPPRPEVPATASWDALSTPAWESLASPAEDAATEGTPLWSATAQDASGESRHGEAPPVPPTTSFPAAEPEPLPSPMEWLAARSHLDAEPTSFRPEVPPRRRRGDVPPADRPEPTMQRPAVPPNPPIRVEERGVAPGQEKRLADILAENGISPATGGRRRRRYRDEDEPDDVLARVLGNN